jgi:hypothetical protein
LRKSASEFLDCRVRGHDDLLGNGQLPLFLFKRFGFRELLLHGLKIQPQFIKAHAASWKWILSREYDFGKAAASTVGADVAYR